MTGAPAVPDLAVAEILAGGAPMEDFAGVAYNLASAESLGQLWREYRADGECCGFVAFVRLTPAQLETVLAQRVRLFDAESNQPGGPVLFLTEQLNLAGRRALLERMRRLSALPGVRLLAGWRGDRLRLHRVRG